MVIDDEPAVLELVCDVLELEGFSVLCLDRPVDPEELWQATSPALFLIDIMLPGTNGIDVARGLRSIDFEDTPMIAMSASMTMVRSAQASGLFAAAIPKPFDLDEMVTLVRRCTG